MKSTVRNLLQTLVILFVFTCFTVNADESMNMREVFEITSEEKGASIRVTACNDKIYIAFDENHNILKSLDGIEWNVEKFGDLVVDEQSKEAIYMAGNPIKVIWDGKRFIALHGGGVISKSKDGVRWTSRRIEEENFAGLSDIVYNGEKYIVLGYDYSTFKLELFYSYDCEKWQKSEVKEAVTHLFGDRPLYTVAWNGKEFIAIGNAGAAAKSYDGEKWIGFDSKTNLDANQIIWDGEKYIAVGVIHFSLSSMDENTNVGAVFSSKDGINWERSFSEKHSEFKDIEWNGNKYIVVGCKSNLEDDETFDFSSGLLKSSKGKMIINDRGVILTSDDGEKWNYQESNFIFDTVMSNNNVFLISGDKDVIKEGQKKYRSFKFFYVNLPALLNND